MLQKNNNNSMIVAGVSSGIVCAALGLILNPSELLYEIFYYFFIGIVVIMLFYGAVRFAFFRLVKLVDDTEINKLLKVMNADTVLTDKRSILGVSSLVFPVLALLADNYLVYLYVSISMLIIHSSYTGYIGKTFGDRINELAKYLEETTTKKNKDKK